MKKFARDNGLADEIDVLLEKRNAAKAVDRQEIWRMMGFLWTTSQYISRILYSRLRKDMPALEEGTKQKIGALFEDLTKIALWECSAHSLPLDITLLLPVLPVPGRPVECVCAVDNVFPSLFGFCVPRIRSSRLAETLTWL